MKYIKIIVPFLFLILTSCQTKNINFVFENKSQNIPTELNQVKNYILKKKAVNSDFDYSKLKNVGKYRAESFEPINGTYTYYQFIATFKGLSYISPGDRSDQTKVFHDILIIKVDDSNGIQDAYQYTLEWAEMPFQFDVYKSDVQNLILIDNLDIKSINLQRTDLWDENDKLFKESGVIQLNVS